MSVAVVVRPSTRCLVCVHDVGAAVHALGAGSPVLNGLPLDRYGLEWVHPEVPLAHPLDGGRAAGAAPIVGRHGRRAR